MKNSIFLIIFILVYVSLHAQDESSGKFGLVDSKGNIIVPFEYDAINFRYNTMHSLPDSVFGIYKNGKCGIISKDGKLLVPFIYDDMKDYTEDGLIIVKKNEKMGVIDIHGREKVPIRYNSVELLSRGLLAVEEGREKGMIVIDTASNTVYSDCFYSAKRMYSNRIWINRRAEGGLSEYGAIDKHGNLKISYTHYDKVENFSRGLAKVSIGESFGVIDSMGNVIVPVEYAYYMDISVKDGFIIVEKDQKKGVLDITGKELIPCMYDYLYSNNGLLEATKNGKKGIIDKNNKVIIEFKYKDFGGLRDGLWTVIDSDNKCGVVNTKGETVIPFKFEHIGNFTNGYATVKKDGKYGIIDTKGKLVIPCTYSHLNVLSENYFEASLAWENNNKGVIDVNNNLIVPYEYQWLSDIGDGKKLAVAKKEKVVLYGLMDYLGNVIIPCEYQTAIYRDDRIILRKP